MEFILPGLALLAVAVLLGLGRWEPPVRVGAWALTIVAAVAAGTVVVLVFATAAGFLLGPARQTQVVEWCRIVPLHHEVGLVEGLVAVAATMAMVVRVGAILRHRRDAVRRTKGRRLSIVETDEPMAYAAPGRPGCVVVSTGLLSSLEPRERQVVFAHERAHLRQGHHRHILIGSLAVAVVPLLKPLVDRLRLVTERCADEEAVTTLGGDRRMVATTIAKAALTRTAYNGVVPAFDGGQVVARVNALIGSPPSAWATRFGLAIVMAGTVSSVGAGSVQMHHLWALVDHLCHG